MSRTIEHNSLSSLPALLPRSYVAVLMPKLDEKKSIGELLEQFDKETP